MIFKKFGGKDIRRNSFRREMVNVSSLNIRCCDCEKSISELPFKPSKATLNDIRCSDCMRSSRDISSKYGGSRDRGFKDRNLRQERGNKGVINVSSLNIECCDCNKSITELPFKPSRDKMTDIRCSGCMQYSRSRGGRRRRF